MKLILPELNIHRKGTKNAEESGFSLAAKRKGKRKGPGTKSDQADLGGCAFQLCALSAKSWKESRFAFSAVNLILKGIDGHRKVEWNQLSTKAFALDEDSSEMIWIS